MPQLFVENSIPPKNAFSRVKIQKSPPKIRRHAYENFIGTVIREQSFFSLRSAGQSILIF